MLLAETPNNNSVNLAVSSESETVSTVLLIIAVE
jgi:hypothetical protein